MEVSRESTEVSEKIITVDLEDYSLLYRIQRGHRFLYVDVLIPDIIPKERRGEGWFVLKRLRLLPEWYSSWRTLIVTGSIESPLCQTDTFPPHSLPPGDLVQGRILYSLEDFEVTREMNYRVFEGVKSGCQMVVKIATFEHQLGYLRQELKTYEALQALGFSHMPKMYGYVFEEQQDRVIGFAMEYLRGPHAGPEDLQDCRKVLGIFHQCGYVMGDPNRYNWIRTDDGMKIFDFEASMPQSEAEVSPTDELEALARHLSDTSGIGRPLDRR